MSTYSHFTEHKRYQLSALMKNEKITLSEIARIICCHRSMIYREFNRNKGKRGYMSKQANTLGRERKATNQDELTDFFWHYVRYLLMQYYSLEQINGRLKHLGFDDVVQLSLFIGLSTKTSAKKERFISIYVVRKPIASGIIKDKTDVDKSPIESIYHIAPLSLSNVRVLVTGKVIRL